MDVYLVKNYYEVYSPQMAPINPTGSWPKMYAQMQCTWYKVLFLLVNFVTTDTTYQQTQTARNTKQLIIELTMSKPSHKINLKYFMDSSFSLIASSLLAATKVRRQHYRQNAEELHFMMTTVK